jgi:hypothetical protein
MYSKSYTFHEFEIDWSTDDNSAQVCGVEVRMAAIYEAIEDYGEVERTLRCLVDSHGVEDFVTGLLEVWSDEVREVLQAQLSKPLEDCKPEPEEDDLEELRQVPAAEERWCSLTVEQVRAPVMGVEDTYNILHSATPAGITLQSLSSNLPRLLAEGWEPVTTTPTHSGWRHCLRFRITDPRTLAIIHKRAQED